MPELFASLPQEPIDRLTAPLRRFLHVQAASGLVLLIASITALVLANSQFGPAYLAFWDLSAEVALGSHAFRETIKHLINDALMAVFFFVVGLEVKRELVQGELRDLRKAILPVAGAIGGMVVPALVYLALQLGQPGMRGWGIPMATDIAFVVGCLAVLGSRVPHSLRIMLLSLAIADDIGAIMVIAIGYTEHLSWPWLSVGAIGIVTVSLLARLGVRSFGVYTLMGIVIWFAFHESGIHATIAGVILGLMTPGRPYVSRGIAGKILDRAREIVSGEEWETLKHRADQARTLERVARETVSPLEYLESLLHPWVSFVIMPLFALCNAAVPVTLAEAGSPVSVAVAAGLVVGKPLGILLFCWLAVRLGLAQLPHDAPWRVIAGGACLAGIGFTMSLFIADLALSSPLLNEAKLGILIGSVLAAVLGFGLLLFTAPSGRDARQVPGPAA